MLIKCKPDPNFHIGITNSTSKDILPAWSWSRRTHFHIIVQMLTHIFVKANLKSSFMMVSFMVMSIWTLHFAARTPLLTAFPIFLHPREQQINPFCPPPPQKRPVTFRALTIHSSLEHACKINFEKTILYQCYVVMLSCVTKIPI